MTTWIEQRDAADGPALGPSSRLARLIWTDPPYATGKTFTKSAGSFSDTLSPEEIGESLVKWLECLTDDGTMCVCLDYRAAPTVAKIITKAGWTYRGEIIWEFHLGRPR